jgi:hypothetical protein
MFHMHFVHRRYVPGHEVVAEGSVQRHLADQGKCRILRGVAEEDLKSFSPTRGSSRVNVFRVTREVLIALKTEILK